MPCLQLKTQKNIPFRLTLKQTVSVLFSTTIVV